MGFSITIPACAGCCAPVYDSFVIEDWIPPTCFAIDILGVIYYADYGSLTINDSGSLPLISPNLWQFITNLPVAGGSLYSVAGCDPGDYDSPITGFTAYFEVTYNTGTSLYTVIAYADGYGVGDQVFNGTGAGPVISNTLGAGSITLAV